MRNWTPFGVAAIVLVPLAIIGAPIIGVLVAAAAGVVAWLGGKHGR